MSVTVAGPNEVDYETSLYVGEGDEVFFIKKTLPMF